jgi:hypothetical protein
VKKPHCDRDVHTGVVRSRVVREVLFLDLLAKPAHEDVGLESVQVGFVQMRRVPCSLRQVSDVQDCEPLESSQC